MWSHATHLGCSSMSTARMRSTHDTEGPAMLPTGGGGWFGFGDGATGDWPEGGAPCSAHG